MEDVSKREGLLRNDLRDLNLECIGVLPLPNYIVVRDLRTLQNKEKKKERKLTLTTAFQ